MVSSVAKSPPDGGSHPRSGPTAGGLEAEEVRCHGDEQPINMNLPHDHDHDHDHAG
jgi:hypothetical protein